MKKILRRELEVAFSRQAQPLWFRIVKWIVFLGGLYLLWGNRYLAYILAIALAGALGLHFFIRYKTKGWTQSYGSWDYEKNKPKDRPK